MLPSKVCATPLTGCYWIGAEPRDTLKGEFPNAMRKLGHTEPRLPTYSPRQGDESDELLS
mgnify:CR=1 FL=1